MADNSERVGSFLVGGLLIGTLIMAAGYGLPSWGWSADRWLGAKPVLDYLLGFTTVAAAFLAGTVALRSFRMNVQAGYATRFQKGVELLAGTSNTSVAGGLEVLADVARLQPRTYQRPVIKVISVHIAEASNSGWTAVMTNNWEKAEHAAKPTVGTFRALSTMNEVVSVEGGTRKRIADRFWRPYLHLVRFDEVKFKNVTFTTMACGVVMFKTCTFDNCKFELLAAKDLVEWDDCTFTDTEITTAKGSHPMEFRNGKLHGLVINGKAIASDGTYPS